MSFKKKEGYGMEVKNNEAIEKFLEQKVKDIQNEQATKITKTNKKEKKKNKRLFKRIIAIILAGAVGITGIVHIFKNNKNKNKNNIDHLSTNIILKNDIIEIIPFQIKWDRYEAVAGGTHTTDQKFNYHISLLKRPISPIDFGVNLSGTIDDLHYKIAKCKFKDLYKDGGAEHNKKTKERLDKIRKEITKHIVL
jgi:hypothetical protein